MTRTWEGVRWFVDVEGNGARLSEIVELGAVETMDLEPTGRSLRWLVKPTEPIDPYATRVHGIRDEDVAHRQALAFHVPEIMSHLQGAGVGGHAVHGDLDIMTRGLPGWRASSAIDSLNLVTNLVEKEGGHRLSAMVEHFGLDERIRSMVGGRAHSAVYDAMASALVVKTLRDTIRPSRFDDAFRQAESLERWDRMVQNRIRKAEKAQRDAVVHQQRRAMRDASGR